MPRCSLNYPTLVPTGRKSKIFHHHLQKCAEKCIFAKLNLISRAMERFTFQMKKWVVRALMTVGAALGLSACIHPKTISEPVEAVYGPPPDIDIEVIEDVYGPPIEELDSVIDSTRTEPEPVSAKPSGK